MRIYLLSLVALLSVLCTNCAASLHYSRVEDSAGHQLLSPYRAVEPLNACTVLMTYHHEVMTLLEARGHTVIPLWPGNLEQQREDQKDLPCDVVLILEKAGGVDTGVDEQDWRFFWAIPSVLSFSLIPYWEPSLERSVIQIVNPKLRKSVRILADMERVLWNSSLAFPYIHRAENTGQYGRARLEMSLAIVSAAESMGKTGELRVSEEPD